MRINPELNICIVKTNTVTGEKTWHYGKNIVTNDGDLYYAQQAVETSPTSDFGGSNGRMELRTGSATPAKGDVFTIMPSLFSCHCISLYNTNVQFRVYSHVYLFHN